MKTLIVGLGNIGAIHGWALEQGGADVTHLVRKESLGRYRQPVKMDVLDLREDRPGSCLADYAPQIVTDVGPGDGYELVMVAVNHYQAQGVVRQIRDKLPEALFLMFTANWEGVAVFEDLLPGPRFLWGFAVSTGARGGDGVLYANIQKSYRIGEIDGTRTPRLDKIIRMFRKAGMEPDLKADIIEWQWVHHAVDAGLLGAALYMGGLPSGDGDLETWRLMIRATRDALAVLEKRGVDIRAYPDTAPFLIPNEEDAAKLLRRAVGGLPHYERVRAHSHFNTRPDEMKLFYRDVLETGEKLGVPMPCLESMKDKILG